MANVLRLRLNPDRLSSEMNKNGPGDPFELDPIGKDATLFGELAILLAILLTVTVIVAIRMLYVEDQPGESPNGPSIYSAGPRDLGA